MNFHRFSWSTALALLTAATLIGPAVAALPPPPAAKKVPVTDDYFGTKVVDPYRWMEQPNNADLSAYLKAQNDRTRAILDSIPARKDLLARLNSLVDTVTSSSDVVRRKNRVFYERISPGSNLAKLYVREGNGSDRVLLDPATLAAGGRHFAITGSTPSDDGKLIAVKLTPDGNEPEAFTRVYDVATGHALADTLQRSDFGATGWRADGKALYYLRFQDQPPGAPLTALYQNVRTYVHTIGSPQSADRAVFGSGLSAAVTIDENEFAAAIVDPSSNYVFGLIIKGVQNEKRLYVTPKAQFDSGKPDWVKVFDYADQATDVTGRGDDIYVVSHKDAPRFQILKTSGSHPDMANAKVIVPPSNRVVDTAAAAKDALYVFERENGIARAVRVDYATNAVTEIPLPVPGTLTGATADPQFPGFIAKLESWTVSPQWFAYDPATNALTNTNLDPPSPVDYSAITSDEVQVPARDGVLIPLSIVHRKDVKLDGNNPTLLYAYGSYGISSSPSFSPSRIAWFERGGVFAVAHVRGGGENGEEWHLAGKDANKMNTIDDFIDCGKWLIGNKYTSSAKLGGRGGSAGGITMGGAITGAPQLFAAILDEIPVSDQLRIELSPNGPPNVPEFGSVRTAAGFKNLYATSAVHHVTPGGKYPAVMLTTGANDPRVDPWQAAKMAATLQAYSGSGHPILLRVDYSGGHGLIGATKSQGAELSADEYTFLLWNMGVAEFQPAI
jgi:prolyl oligopeptidase